MNISLKFSLVFLFLVASFVAYSQNTLSIIVRDADTQEPLVGATVYIQRYGQGTISDIEGKVTFTDLPNRTYTLAFSFVGYETRLIKYELPFEGSLPDYVELESGEELETIIVSATRSSRSILDNPTRVEAITSEELGEKAVMNSANISMLLRESSGIMVQQTSANSGNQSLRIQGLDGRYTQLLKDGFPLFSGFAGGLSIMQVPPLDLQQVEVIKGSASTLYGGGAIAGLVNLVSKQPIADEPELSLILNQTTAGGTTGNLFYGQHYGKTGITFYASANRQEPYDPNEDNFSDIPQVRSYTINPKLFLYPNDRTTAWIGLSASVEDRIGGDLDVIAGNVGGSHTFSEENQSERLAAQGYYSYEIAPNQTFQIRGSLNQFNRTITIPSYQFVGTQLASFSEVTYSLENGKSEWIIGANLFTNDFRDKTDDVNVGSRDYNYTTLSAFSQNTTTFHPKLTVESGFRLDHNQKFGFFPLPRLSLLYKATPDLTLRLGGGLGYKLPSIFNEESEVISFQGINPIDLNTTDPETSRGVNFDINVNRLIGNRLSFSWNQLFFYTQLKNTLVLRSASNGSFTFENANGPVRSIGFESNAKIGLDDFALYLQYSFTDVSLNYDNLNHQKPLTPKHNLGLTLMYEEEDKWRIGYELYYIGQQYRSDFSQTEDYWMMGFMAMRQIGRLSLFVNFENFTDTRQSRFQSMITPPATDPTLTEVWAPTDGFVANGGLMIRFL